MARAGQSTARLIVSSDVINQTDAVPSVYAMHIVNTDPRTLLAVRIGEHGWAVATEIDRPLRKRLPELLGQATPEEMDQVDAAMRAVFDLP